MHIWTAIELGLYFSIILGNFGRNASPYPIKAAKICPWPWPSGLVNKNCGLIPTFSITHTSGIVFRRVAILRRCRGRFSVYPNKLQGFTSEVGPSSLATRVYSPQPYLLDFSRATPQAGCKQLPSATIIEVAHGLVDAAILACMDATPRPLVSQGKVMHIFRQDYGQVSTHATIAIPRLCAVWPFF